MEKSQGFIASLLSENIALLWAQNIDRGYFSSRKNTGDQSAFSEYCYTAGRYATAIREDDHGTFQPLAESSPNGMTARFCWHFSPPPDFSMSTSCRRW